MLQNLQIDWQLVSLFLVEGKLWILLAAAIVATIISTAWFKGIFGEFLVRLATDFCLDGEKYHPIHNIILKTPDGTTQIDHILVSRYGVFVIETKNLKGWVFGDARSKRWTQSLYRKKFSFQNPLHQNYKHVKAVESLLSLPAEKVHSVVVFTGRSKFKTPMPPNVTTLKNFLTYVRSMSEEILSKQETRKISRKLNFSNLPLIGSTSAHVKRLKKNEKEPVCPRCGVKMAMRTATKGVNSGSQFWGCTNYPKCRMTRKLID